jgi:hypothetical protein
MGNQIGYLILNTSPQVYDQASKESLSKKKIRLINQSTKPKFILGSGKLPYSIKRRDANTFETFLKGQIFQKTMEVTLDRPNCLCYT